LFTWPLSREYRAISSVREPQKPKRNADVEVSMGFHTAGGSIARASWGISSMGEGVPGTNSEDDPYRREREAHPGLIHDPTKYRLVTLDELIADPFGDESDGVAAGSTPDGVE
jgi:hypothetical protein